MKPAGARRQPKGLEFRRINEQDPSSIKALQVVIECRPKQAEQTETEPAAGDKQAG